MDNSSVIQNRRSRRSQVYLTAMLEGSDASHSVKLRNLSEQGALVEGTNLPTAGSEVVFNRKELSTPGRVVWTDGTHAGIAFYKLLKAEEVLRHVPPPRPMYKPDFRRPGLACRELSAAERKLIDSWLCTASPDRPGE